MEEKKRPRRAPGTRSLGAPGGACGKLDDARHQGDCAMRGVAFSRPFFGVEEERAAAAVIGSGWVVGGPKLREFEERFAKICGAEYAVGVSSWTTGGFLVLKALGIGPGDEVIVPSLTFIASVNVIVHAGAKPVFVDIDPRTFNLDPADAARKIGPRTRAILPVDQLGMPCEIDAILELAKARGLLVIQDAACAIGSRFRERPIGGIAPITIFSLHARKVVTTGEGGMIVTNDAPLAARLRMLRRQGCRSPISNGSRRPHHFESYPKSATISGSPTSRPRLEFVSSTVSKICWRGGARLPSAISPRSPITPASSRLTCRCMSRRTGNPSRRACDLTVRLPATL